MDQVEVALSDLGAVIDSFITPTRELRDIATLKAQIELRRLALRDIQLIRARLRPLVGRRIKSSIRRPSVTIRRRQQLAFASRKRDLLRGALSCEG